jgi:hypothetical protein
MIFTNVLINQIKGDKSRKQNAREEFWKAQDSCLFSPCNDQIKNELRKAAYSSLIRAEKLSREKGKFISSLIQYDFNLDGKMEYLFQDAIINFYIQLMGAGIFELDYLPKDWNYLDCGAQISVNNRRIAFADSILPFESYIDDLNIINEKSRYCFNEEYEALAQARKGKSCFKLSEKGSDVPFGDIEIVKCYILKKDTITVTYTLKNTGTEIQNFCFVTEIDLSFTGVGNEFARFYTVDTNGKDNHIDKKIEKTETLKIQDVMNEVQILLISSNAFSGCLFPVYNNGHYQDNEYYQATCILPHFYINLESGKTWNNEFTLKFSH